ncbi:F-box domain-containing protein [Mycena venus]|uniref:F-box domain-containing protein n=1 Tax=Mycena venus TaxID=2733690 RepID=A0A8H6XVS8_9AGAR|nr:F-box domain-containing protein [Mycena venus]
MPSLEDDYHSACSLLHFRACQGPARQPPSRRTLFPEGYSAISHSVALRASIATAIQSTMDSLANHKALIADAEAKVVHFDAQIKNFTHLREQELSRISSLKAAIAPIRKVPPELVTEIFLDVACSSTSQFQSALQLSQVSVRWRELALRIPRLWVELPIKVANNSADYIAITKMLLQRSLPLSIPISFARLSGKRQNAPEPTDQPISKAMVDTLLSVANRGRTLRVVDYDVFLQLSRLPLDTFQRLETVELSFHGPRAVAERHPIAQAFLHAPRLREVTLWVRNTQLFPMPWVQLTYLCLTDPSPQTCLDILVECANISNVVIDTLPWERWEVVPHQTPRVLPKLASLNLQFDTRSVLFEDVVIAPFLSCICAPALKTLELQSFGHFLAWLPFTAAALHQFLPRCPNIEYFHLNYFDISPQELRSLLVDVPSLLHLTINDCQNAIDDILLEALTYSEPDTAHLVPKLEKLTLFLQENWFPEKKLFKLIRSRWWPDDTQHASLSPPAIARLQYVDLWYIGGYRKWSAWFQSEVQQLKSGGLEIVAKE